MPGASPLLGFATSGHINGTLPAREVDHKAVCADCIMEPRQHPRYYAMLLLRQIAKLQGIP
ncbi:MAG: hypothetical protein Q8K82_18750, partial [Gemmatimonadaceae bacterium]|nr:hypothetical protein [Gemmatimonadaceae bacterium]